jgi:hypothetical protein
MGKKYEPQSDETASLRSAAALALIQEHIEPSPHNVTSLLKAWEAGADHADYESFTGIRYHGSNDDYSSELTNYCITRTAEELKKFGIPLNEDAVVEIVSDVIDNVIVKQHRSMLNRDNIVDIIDIEIGMAVRDRLPAYQTDPVYSRELQRARIDSEHDQRDLYARMHD